MMQRYKTADDLSSYFDLIPQNPQCLLHEPRLRYQHLRLLTFILNHTIAAINSLFIEKDYANFDPHIGDTLCQIRAAQVLQIAADPQFNVSEYRTYLDKISLKVKLLTPVIERSISIRRSPELKKKENNQTLEQFLMESKIHFYLHTQIDYLTKTYLLTQYKTTSLGNDTKINIKQLCSDATISKDLAVRLVRHWQKSISKHSCDTIKLSSVTAPKLVDLLKLTDDDNREVLPAFFVMKHVINFIKAHHFNFLLIVKNPLDLSITPIAMLFKHQDGRFELSNKVTLDMPCFTVQGISHLLQKLQKDNYDQRCLLSEKIIFHGIEKILLASAAIHPQYSGQKLSSLNEGNIYQKFLSTLDQNQPFYNELYNLSSEYTKAKTFAKEYGCDYKKPDFIFAEHILAGTPESQAQTVEVNMLDWVEKTSYKSYLYNEHSGIPLITQNAC